MQSLRDICSFTEHGENFKYERPLFMSKSFDSNQECREQTATAVRYQRSRITNALLPVAKNSSDSNVKREYETLAIIKIKMFNLSQKTVMWLDIFFRRDIFKSREMHLHVSLTPPFPSKSTGDKSQRKFYQKNKIEEGCDIRFI